MIAVCEYCGTPIKQKLSDAELSHMAKNSEFTEAITAAIQCIRNRDYKTAIEEYTKAWLLDKTNSDVLMNLAHCYRQNGDTKKADELYQQVIDTFPDTQNAIDAADYMTETNG